MGIFSRSLRLGMIMETDWDDSISVTYTLA